MVDAFSSEETRRALWRWLTANGTVNPESTAPSVVTAGAGSSTASYVRPSQGTLTDRSGTITSGGAAQQIAAANASRRYLLVQNVSDTDMWVNLGTTAVATQPSLLLKASGGSLVMESGFISTELVSVIGATTGKAFSAKEA